MMKKSIILFVGALLGNVYTANAQKIPTYTQQQYNLSKVKNYWINTNNAAGIGRDTLKTVNFVEIGYQHTSGDFKLAQDARRINDLNFLAESNQSIGKNFVIFGRFGINYNHQDERAWYDGITDTGNPYVWGSNREGNYNRYLYTLNVKVATRQLGKFTYGFGLDYQVSDLSRLLDPRPRVMYANYKLIPSITYQINKNHSLGLNGYYHFEKERMNNIITVRRDVEYEYFMFEGNENYYSTTSLGSLSRRNVADSFGADLQYNYHNENWNIFSSIGYSIMKEDIIEDNQASPGRYDRYNVSASLGAQYQTSKLLHSFKVAASYKSGQANQFIQEEQNITMGNGDVFTKWVTLHDNVTYKNKGYQVDANYNLYFGNVVNDDYFRKLGVYGSITSFENKYILPESTNKLSFANLGLNYDERILHTRKGHELWLETNVMAYHRFSQNVDLDIENEYTAAVMRPNENFYNDDMLTYRVGASYNLPVQLKKSKLNFFVKAFYQNTALTTKGDRMNIGVSVGLVNL